MLEVTSATQLSTLRAMVSQELTLHPLNCTFYACAQGRWSRLEGDDLSLKGALPFLECFAKVFAPGSEARLRLFKEKQLQYTVELTVQLA